MKLYPKRTALVLVLFVGTSIAQTVKSDYDKKFAFDRLKTFDFKTVPHPPGDLIYDGSENDRRLKKALDSQLSANGYQRAVDGHPDFYVVYFSKVKDKVGGVNHGPDIPGYSGGRDIRTEYNIESTVVVDFLDAKTDARFWRGSVSNTLDRNHPQEKIDRGVKKLIQHFLEDAKKTS